TGQWCGARSGRSPRRRRRTTCWWPAACGWHRRRRTAAWSCGRPAGLAAVRSGPETSGWERGPPPRPPTACAPRSSAYLHLMGDTPNAGRLGDTRNPGRLHAVLVDYLEPIAEPEIGAQMGDLHLGLRRPLGHPLLTEGGEGSGRHPLEHGRAQAPGRALGLVLDVLGAEGPVDGQEKGPATAGWPRPRHLAVPGVAGGL